MFSAKRFPPSSEAIQYFLGRSLRKTINATVNTCKFYQRGLDFYPRFTAIATGAVLWGLGDIFVQIKIDQVEKFEWSRLYGSVTYGAVITGLVAFYWYNFIHWAVYDYLRLTPKTFSFVAAKIVLELFVFAPASLVCFWMIMGKYEGQKARQIIDHMRENNKYFDSLKIDWALWLPIDILNFAFVPVQYQILAVNVGCMIEAVILGKLEADACRREAEHAAHEKMLRVKAAELLAGKVTRCVKTDNKVLPSAAAAAAVEAEVGEKEVVKL